ncbi:adenylate/guanylate cyclase domain-containing protein [Bacteroidota bacterium]
MNFLYILRRFVFIFLASSCWTYLGIDLSASHYQELGHPYIQACFPGTYTYINHYNSIVQSEDGFIFIGARNGILSYNGTSWKHITVKGNIHLLNHQDRILAWSKDQLGYLLHTPLGDFEFVPEEAWNTGDILHVQSHSNNLYILTTGGLFIRGSTGQAEIKLDQEPQDIFPSGEGIFILAGEKTLYHHSGDQPEIVQLPGGIEHITHILPLDDETLIIDGINSKVYLIGSEEVPPEISRPAGFLEEFGFSSIVRLSSGQIVYGTLGGGLILTTKAGEVITRIGVDEGLYGNDIISLLVDASDNLWAVHNDAVSRIEIPSEYSYFNHGNGLEGNIRDLLRFNGTMYAASSRGLFSLLPQEEPFTSSSENAGFIRVSGVKADCRCLAGTNVGLFFGGSMGLFLLEGQKIREILSDPVNTIYYCKERGSLLTGTDQGIRILNLDDMKINQDPSLPKISIDGIAVSPEGFLWLSSKSGALYRTAKPVSGEGNLSYSSFTAGDLQAAEGSYINMIHANGRLFFSSPTGLFLFNQSQQVFVRDTTFKLPLPDGSYRIGAIKETTDSILWIILDQGGIRMQRTWLARLSDNGTYDIEPFSYRRLNSKTINCLYSEKENLMWVGTHDGLLRLDSRFGHRGIPTIRTHISGIEVADEGALHSIPPDKLFKIPYAKNRLHFKYLSTDYNCGSEPLFQYRLKGLTENWSEWNPNSFVDFRGLKRGNYEFLVRSQDAFGVVSETDSFRFRIKAPLYAAWYTFLFYVLVILIIIYFVQKWLNLRQLREQYHLEEVVLERTESLIKEKEKADDILANILPKTTSDELKLTGKVTSSKFKMCTVLFADIQGFTKIAEEMDADKLIDQLDRFYFQFDSVMEKYNIEKIKTIGDAYMAAGGIPIKNRTNPVEVVLAALEMQKYMKDLKKTKADIWDLRIGIHTGSVIAGVVGQKKYSYDIWGDSVNTASRMESSGEAGKVNISATTYKLIKDYFQCEFRGKMPVKYKGDIAMFFVNGLNPVFSEADKITPNVKFLIQIQLLRLLDLEEFVIEKLDKELPEDLFFHNTDHTSHVYAQVELLGLGEKISDEDLLLLRSAALLHDMGYIDQMDDHEARSVEYAREILPLYRYSEDQIEKICKLILATSVPPDPQNLLEQIICDANLDHIGRVDFLIQSDKLFQEYRMRHKIRSKNDWNNYQVSFLESHDFYTDIAKKMREVPKEQQIENIKQFS